LGIGGVAHTIFQDVHTDGRTEKCKS